MPSFKYQCENCDSIFTINYNEEQCEDDPAFCPICAEPLFYDDEIETDE